MKIVALYRVSTDKQGRSGLGLAGQVAAVEAYARANGATILRSYQEVETGKRSDRPELLKALADCRRSKAVLCIAKLDRLARNVAFVSSLMESNVEFVCCDNPHASRLTLHILASVAEDEAVRISLRTKAALQALKARGVLLGSARPGHPKIDPTAAARGRLAASQALSDQADAAYEDIAGMVAGWRADGCTLAEIAKRLTEEGHTTRRGKPWGHSQVRRLLARQAGTIVMAG